MLRLCYHFLVFFFFHIIHVLLLFDVYDVRFYFSIVFMFTQNENHVNITEHRTCERWTQNMLSILFLKPINDGWTMFRNSIFRKHSSRNDGFHIDLGIKSGFFVQNRMCAFVRYHQDKKKKKHWWINLIEVLQSLDIHFENLALVPVFGALEPFLVLGTHKQSKSLKRIECVWKL